MSRKFSKILIQIIQIIVFAAISFLCFQGFTGSPLIEDKFRFAECFARCFFYAVFMFLYFRSLSSKFGTNTILFSLYLLFAVCSEARVISSVVKVTSFVFFNPMVGVRFTLFSSIIMFLCLAGYGLYYSNNDNSAIMKYFWISCGAALIISLVTPTVGDTMLALTIQPVHIILDILVITVIIIFTLQLITNISDPFSLRLIAGLILCIGNAMNIFFDTFVMNELATILTIIGLIIIYGVAKLSDIKL